MIDMPVALVILGVLGTIVAGIFRLPLRGSSNSNPGSLGNTRCMEHSGLVARIDNIEDDIAQIKEGIQELLKR